MFNALTREHLVQIIEIQLRRVKALLEARGLKLELTEAAKDLVLGEGYDPNYGARPLRRTIQRLIQDPLSLKLLSGEFLAGDTVVADADSKTHTLLFEKQAVAV